LPPLLIAKRASRRSTRSSSMPAGWTSMDDEIHAQHDTHHTIDRFQVSEIICRVCYTKQSSKTYVLLPDRMRRVLRSYSITSFVLRLPFSLFFSFL
jgi:hypothetical protein